MGDDYDVGGTGVAAMAARRPTHASEHGAHRAGCGTRVAPHRNQGDEYAIASSASGHPRGIVLEPKDVNLPADV